MNDEQLIWLARYAKETSLVTLKKPNESSDQALTVSTFMRLDQQISNDNDEKERIKLRKAGIAKMRAQVESTKKYVQKAFDENVKLRKAAMIHTIKGTVDARLDVLHTKSKLGEISMLGEQSVSFDLAEDYNKIDEKYLFLHKDLWDNAQKTLERFAEEMLAQTYGKKKKKVFDAEDVGSSKSFSRVFCQSRV